MNKLELEWETFDFYTSKIQVEESTHASKMHLIQSFLKKDHFSSEDKKEELLRDFNTCCDNLLLLYKKQVDSLSSLIQLNKDIVDVPPEREVSTNNLIALRNTTSTLIMQVLEHKKDMGSMLGSDEDFSI